MIWLSGTIDLKPAPNRDDFRGDVVLRKEEILVLHGVVTDGETGMPFPQALVELHARRKNGVEYLICRTLSANDGKYLLYLDTNKITDDTTAIVVEANNGILTA